MRVTRLNRRSSGDAVTVRREPIISIPIFIKSDGPPRQKGAVAHEDDQEEDNDELFWQDGSRGPYDAGG
jgi:hypothetical protein